MLRGEKMKKSVVAIIGCGTIANLQHLPQLSANSDVKIKYACDIIEERAKAASDKYSIEKYCTDYKDILADPEVEAVFVLTPNYKHYTISMDALKSGKHVFCEKPITINYELSSEMANAAKKYGKMLDIGVCNRAHRSIQIIKKMIDDGELGEVYHTYVSFRSYRSIPGLGGDFTTKKVAGGGVLIDWGVHLIDLTLYCLGLPKVKTVSANCYAKLGKDIDAYVFNDMWAGPPKSDGINDVEEFVTGFIRTEKASMSFNGAWAQNINQYEMFIDFLGDKAGIRLNYGEGFTLYNIKNGILQTVTPQFKMPNHYYAEDKAFIESMYSGKKTCNNIEYVLETMKVLDAIYESDKEKKEITL